MLELFYRIQENFKDNKIVYHKIYKILNKIVNFLIIKEYKYFKKKDKKKFIPEDNIIISLTSFPARIDSVWICIESLFNQDIKFDKIILWLAKTQFKSLNELPETLKHQMKKGLEIRFCDDLKSHKKYYYTMLEYPNSLIITVDDDVFYPKYTISKLYNLYRKNKGCICCNRAHKIKINGDSILSYNDWEYCSRISEIKKKDLVPTGVGGVLYPPNSLNNEVFKKEKFMNICFYADDLWLKSMATLNNTYVIKTKDFPQNLFTIKNTQKNALSQLNVDENKNDNQFINILNEYDLKYDDFID